MDSSDEIVLHVNGEEMRLPLGSTVADLVAARGLTPREVAVERNREIVPRAEHGAVALKSGDRLEIVTLVGGG
ncbi:MAG: sulfur carrier protein ThiS [Planctomycetota bacterium]